jgi:hypothetical protein
MLGQRDVKIGIESRKERSVRILMFGRDQFQNTDGLAGVDMKALSDVRSVLHIADHFAALASR